MKKIGLIDAVICSLVIMLVTCTLIPAVARMQRDAGDARCQSNMRRFAQALALYIGEFGKYPTNRKWNSNGTVGPIIYEVAVSYPELDEKGQPIRFIYGMTWVESLYPYLINAANKTDQDWDSFLRCPKAYSHTFPTSAANARTTYAFNACMVEIWPALLRDPAELMMLREMDRRVNASLRPTGNSIGTDAFPPRATFLNDYDWRFGTANNPTDPRLHAEGSHIVFADGHVRCIPDYYYKKTDGSYLNDYDYSGDKSHHWDAETLQWYNWVFTEEEMAADPLKREINKAIAITP